MFIFFSFFSLDSLDSDFMNTDTHIGSSERLNKENHHCQESAKNDYHGNHHFYILI